MFTAPAGPRRDRPPAKRQVKSFTLRSRGGRLGSPQFGARGAACRTFLTLPKDHHASLVTKDRSRRAMLVCETPHVNPWSMTTRGSGGSRCSCPGALAARGQGGCHPQRGWWESVTVTWSPAPAPDRRPAVLPRALGAAAGTIAPVLADVAVASARRLLERQYRIIFRARQVSGGRFRARPALVLISWVL